MKASAVARGFESNFAVMIADDRLADGKTHPGALSRFFRREERIEDARLVLGRDSPARILNGDFHSLTAVVLASAGADPQYLAGFVHCVECVHDEIQDNLLDLIGVAKNRKRLAGEVLHNSNTAPCRFSFDEGSSVLHD
jgi:hypothetical protein